MADIPETEDESRTTNVTDGYFEEEFHVDSEAAGDFLVELGEQLRSGDEVTVAGEDWEIPFPVAEPVGLEVEFEGDGERELEVEVELDGRREGDEAPSVE
jgi:amphi-Trp domain-containing protein